MIAAQQGVSALAGLLNPDELVITESDQPVWGSVDDDVAGRAEC